MQSRQCCVLDVLPKFNNASTADSPASQFAGTSVSRSKSLRVLGITVDQLLTFDSHVTKIVGCRPDYGNALLRNVAENASRLPRAQNSLARVVCNVSSYRCSSQPILKSLQLYRLTVATKASSVVSPGEWKWGLRWRPRLAQWHVHWSWATSTSVSTWIGDRQGRPSSVYLCPFVGVDLNLWLTVYTVVIVLTRT